ncbi:putative Haloacid dehalogenase [Seiridium unicorne]|uniref:Haloacid dehalogenase n=1 Tax=Seiridium unicorne TaxID=138068 RepID=A0ABR2VDK1_9PEZI
MTSGKTVIAFDLYGTLLSTESIAQELAKLFGEEKAPAIAAAWRRSVDQHLPQTEHTGQDAYFFQLEQYQTFSQVTRSSLKHALLEHKLDVTEKQENNLMQAYDALHNFPEVPAALKLLSEKSDVVDPYIFSNGTVEMVGNSVKSSPDLGPHAGLFKAFITVDSLKVYKPAMKVYEHLLSEVGKQGKSSDVWLVSANPFDAVGAKVAGLKAAWVDRAGKGWVDRLDPIHVPTIIATGVEDAVKGILAWTTDNH